MIYENTPTIGTGRLIFRKFVLDNARAFFEIIKDEETNRFLPYFPPRDLDEGKVILQQKFLSYYYKPSA